jgi:hypothetical protein
MEFPTKLSEDNIGVSWNTTGTVPLGNPLFMVFIPYPDPVVEICFEVLQRPLWNRVVQFSRRKLPNAVLHYLLGLGREIPRETQHQREVINRGEVSSCGQIHFNLLPTLIDLALVAGFASSRFGIYCDIKVGVVCFYYISFTIWSAGRIAQRERKRRLSKNLIVDVRLVIRSQVGIC